MVRLGLSRVRPWLLPSMSAFRPIGFFHQRVPLGHAEARLPNGVPVRFTAVVSPDLAAALESHIFGTASSLLETRASDVSVHLKASLRLCLILLLQIASGYRIARNQHCSLCSRPRCSRLQRESEDQHTSS